MSDPNKPRRRAYATMDVPAGRVTSGDPTLLQIINSLARDDTGAGSQYDLGTRLSPGARMVNPAQWEGELFALYKSDWSAKKIVNIPVEDMFREGWDYEGITHEDSKKLTTYLDDLQLVSAFEQAKRQERLFGGAVIFMGISDGLALDQPIDTRRLKRNALRFLNVVPRSQCTPAMIESDPLSPGYGRPRTFWVGGAQVHRSRLVIFDGAPLMSTPGQVASAWSMGEADGFGDSVIVALIDDLTRASGTRQAAMQMVQRNGAIVAYQDLTSLSGTTQGEAAIQKVKDVVNMLNLYRGAVLHKDPTDAGQPINALALSFGSVPELLMSYLQVLSAASDIPAMRFLQEAPSGLGSNGDASMEGYYGRLESEQTKEISPRIRQILAVAVPSVFEGTLEADTIEITYPPLWSMSEEEESRVRTADVSNVIALLDAALIDEAQAVDELRKRGALLIDPDAPPERILAGTSPESQTAAIIATLKKLDEPEPLQLPALGNVPA